MSYVHTYIHSHTDEHIYIHTYTIHTNIHTVVEEHCYVCMCDMAFSFQANIWTITYLAYSLHNHYKTFSSLIKE